MAAKLMEGRRIPDIMDSELERRLGFTEALLRAAPMAVFVKDVEGRYLGCNEAFSDIVGVSPEAILGKTVFDLWPPDLAETYHRQDMALLDRPGHQVYEFRVRTARGNLIDVIFNKDVFRNEDGVVKGIVGTFLDITARKQAEATVKELNADLERRVAERTIQLEAINAEIRNAEEARRESETRYRLLLESVTDYIYTVQVRDGRPAGTVHGPGCVAVTGYTSEHYAADPDLWFRMVYEPDRLAVIHQSESLLSGEAAPPLEHRIIHRNGSVRWVRNTPVPHRDAQGRMIAWDGLIYDISERKWAEETLRDREEELSAIYGDVPVLLLLVDSGGLIRKVNEAVLRFSGLTREEGFGGPGDFLRCFHAINHVGGCGASEYCQGSCTLRRCIRETLSGARNHHLVEVTHTLMIQERWENFTLLLSTTRLVIREEPLVLVSILDITERKRAEIVALWQQRRAQQYLDIAGVGIMTLDREGKVSLINRKGCEILGWNEDETIGRNWFESYLPERIRQEERSLFDCMMVGEMLPRRYAENLIFSRSGQERLIACHNVPLTDVQGAIVGILSSFQDITEQRSLEEKLLNVEDSWRRRVGHELHDGLAQLLSGMSFLSGSLEDRLAEQPELDLARELTRLLDRAKEEVRSLVTGFAPEVASGSGLPSLLSVLSSQTKKLFGAECLLAVQTDLPVLETSTISHLYRIAQEAVTNAIRHGAAKTLHITLETSMGHLRLCVDDNGRGFQGKAETGPGLGLKIMRYRARMIGAELSIGVSPMGGIRIECTLPAGRIQSAASPATGSSL